MRELAETTERIAHDRRVRHAYEDLCHKLHLETVPIQTPGFVGCGRAGLSSSSYSSSSSSAISWKKWNGKASSAEYQTRAGSGLLFQGRFYVQGRCARTPLHERPMPSGHLMVSLGHPFRVKRTPTNACRS